jgi:alkylation response protein AidB-like acyl-CoA dehydrogenase
MAIGITEEHDELRQVVRRFVESKGRTAPARAALEADADALPEFWDALAETGWIGLHVTEELGGHGYGLTEVAVVLEELGRACVPGPFLPSVLAAAVIGESDAEPARKELLPGLAAGSLVGTIALGEAVAGRPADGGGMVLAGTASAVWSGAVADVVVVACRVGDTEAWVAVDASASAITERRSLDPTRRVADVVLDDVAVPPGRVLAGVDRQVVEGLAAVLLAAEAAGIGDWCVESAAEYAKVRQQFGRPIGQFQGVKHRLAEMLARTELARAAAWDASRAWGDDDNGAAVAVAAAAALAAGVRDTAKECVQTFGGIGFTWEHDAHLFLRRAGATHQLLGSVRRWHRDAAVVALGGVRRKLDVELPPEADRYRDEVRSVIAELDATDDRGERRRLLADRGYIAPSWPAPWGRDASALEQLVIEEEFRRAKKRRPNLGIAAWALPTIIVYGTEEQQDRWVRASLRGEIAWCQLFSEPGAGSDLAALTTRATRSDTDAGWIVNGQKVWTSMAREADWGILLARTDPDAPKHDGITCFMLDMKSPGIDIRPLRELTGMAMFNEVFLDDVFIPDDCVVGAVNDGWRAARTTLANERVYMGGGATIAGGVVGVMEMLRASGLDSDPDWLDDLGRAVCTQHALGVLGFRLTLQALSGADPSGSEASVRKLLGTRSDQHIGELGLGLLGMQGLADDGEAAPWVYQYLFNQALTIAGGTSDIQRNVIAERMLGLPRDP